MHPGTKGIRTLRYLLNNFILLFHIGVPLLVVIGIVVVVVVVPVTVVVVVEVPVAVVEVEDVFVIAGEAEDVSNGTADMVFLSLISTSVLVKFPTKTIPSEQL